GRVVNRSAGICKILSERAIGDRQTASIIKDGATVTTTYSSVGDSHARDTDQSSLTNTEDAKVRCAAGRTALDGQLIRSRSVDGHRACQIGQSTRKRNRSCCSDSDRVSSASGDTIASRCIAVAIGVKDGLAQCALAIPRCSVVRGAVNGNSSEW